jgi:predicted transposase YdaD
MIRTFDLTKTRAGRELMDLGKAEGKTEGRTETLLKILTKRLGKLTKSVVSQIEHLNYIQLEKLEDIVLDVQTVAELSAWLRKLKPQR